LNNVHEIINRINQGFTAKSEIRDRTLKRSRELIRYCANSIRATHRDDDEEATELLQSAQSIAAEMVTEARQLPDIYFAGYTQDALKEYSEAHLTRALILGEALPTPQDLDVEDAAYINGLAETVGELRRYALDALRRGEVATSEKMLDMMEMTV